MLRVLVMSLLLRRARHKHPEMFDSYLAEEQVRLAIEDQINLDRGAAGV